MVFRVKICFGVRHQTKHASGGIAQPRYRVQRPVGVVRKFLRRLAGGGIGITAGNSPHGFHSLQQRPVGCEEAPFAMANWQRHPIQPAREDAGRVRLKPNLHPEILKYTHFVLNQRQPLLEIFSVKARQQPQFHHNLKTVAHAHDEPPVRQKTLQRLAQPMPQPRGEHMARRHMVAEGESANEHQRGVVLQAGRTLEQIVQMHQIRRRARQRPGMTGFGLAVETVSRDDQNARLAIHGGESIRAGHDVNRKRRRRLAGRAFPRLGKNGPPGFQALENGGAAHSAGRPRRGCYRDSDMPARDPFDFWYAVHNTAIVVPPERRLETFGATIIDYRLVTEPMDTVGQVRIRTGRLHAHRPEIITPGDFFRAALEGFESAEAERYLDWLRQHESDLLILKYGFHIRKDAHTEELLRDNVEAVVERIRAELRERPQPFGALLVGVDDPWEVCLIKLIVDMVQRSAPGHARELRADPHGYRREIEEEFRAAARDPELIPRLADKLRKHGLFEAYQDRFFSLVRAARR